MFRVKRFFVFLFAPNYLKTKGICFRKVTFFRFEAGGNFKETIKKFLSLQRGGFNVIIWAAGTVGSVLMATYDEYMAKPDIVVIEKADTLIIWRYLSLWRATCALLGWFFVALQPNNNYTRDRLLRLVGVSCGGKFEA